MQPPNILLLYTDSHRWDAIGVNGNPDILTPSLDALAHGGVNFTHCFVQNPFCMPSRASLLSGIYPSAHRVMQLGTPLDALTLTLPRLLQPYGYHSAYLGKLHLTPHANRDHRAPHPSYGFDRLVLSDEPGVYEDAYRAWVRRLNPSQLPYLSIGLTPAAQAWYELLDVEDPVAHPSAHPRSPEPVTQPFAGDEAYTHTAFVAGQTLSFLQQQNRSRPFLCVAGFFAPHAPWTVPQRYLDRYDVARINLPDTPRHLDPSTADTLRAARRGYYAAITEVDSYIGEIIAVLRTRRLLEQTIVIVTADHGEWLGAHGRFGKGYPGDDSVSRVPLLIHWPAGIPTPGRRVSALVEAVDIVPTLLECAGVQAPSQLHGESFRSALLGEPFVGRTTTFIEHAGWKGLRTSSHRYAISATGGEQLWDLAADPEGEHDLAADAGHAAVLATMRALLLQRLLQHERPAARTWLY